MSDSSSAEAMAAPVLPEGRLRVWRRRILRTLAGLVVLALAFLIVTPIGRYLLRAGWEEAKILQARRPIAALVADSSLTPAVRRKLELVLEARAFAKDSLGLDAGESFTTFTQLRRDTLVLVLSGVYPDRLAQKTWWFPIVGSVPYKGYFDVDDAKRAAADLREDGFDVYLRPAAAFSTLGWFNDPVVSTTLRADSIDLVNTVIHELTHNTYYAPGSATFNESFANFVGSRGVAAFFRSRGSARAADEADAGWSDDRLLADFWKRLYRTVDSSFKAHPGDENRGRRIAVRDTIYRAARDTLIHVLGPRLRVIGPRALERMRIDNSAVMARRVYLTDVDLFDAVWVREKRNLRSAVDRIISIAREDEARRPFDAVRRYLGR
jgi:predicted aminopeptidase